MNTAIPFLDLVTPHLELEDELVGTFRNALRTANFVGGAMVEAFETDFAKFCGTRFCVGVNSGTDALRFALIAAGIRPGDVVITVPNTFIATTEAISQAGAIPEFVDIEERTYNLDPGKLKDYLETKCTRDRSTGCVVSRRSGHPVTSIIPVHLYGQVADMDPIMEMAEHYHLIVIEDACQAHGAEYFSQKAGTWRKAGSMGRAGAFSFYPGKNLGACGEAGAITTDDENVAKSVRMLRDHGQVTRYQHDVEGYNGRLDAIQAGFLHAKLHHLPKWNAQRRERAAVYARALGLVAESVILPHEPSWSRAVHHLYVVRVHDREGLMGYLKTRDIGTAIHYPIPLHLQNACRSLGYGAGDFPVGETIAKEIVSLPMFPQITTEQQSRVADEIAFFVQSRKSRRDTAAKLGDLVCSERTA